MWKNVVKGEYSLVSSIAKHWNWCLVPEIMRMIVIDNESICEWSVCALGYIFWHPNSHTMKVNVMKMVWLSERPPVKAKIRHSLIFHLKRAEGTDRNFQLRNKFDREKISVSKKKMKLITRIQETILKYWVSWNCFRELPLARPQTTLYRMIVLPASVIKDRMRVRYCGDNNSVWADFPTVINIIILPFGRRGAYESMQSLPWW